MKKNIEKYNKKVRKLQKNCFDMDFYTNLCPLEENTECFLFVLHSFLLFLSFLSGSRLHMIDAS